MRSEIRLPRRAITGRAARRMFLRCCLAAIGAGYCATVTSALGASAAAGSSSPTTAPSPVLASPHGSWGAQSRGPLDLKLDYLAVHSHTVDRLYEELMRWTEPACWSASAAASVAGGC
jgi:hypothetical protein